MTLVSCSPLWLPCGACERTQPRFHTWQRSRKHTGQPSNTHRTFTGQPPKLPVGGGRKILSVGPAAAGSTVAGPRHASPFVGPGLRSAEVRGG